jgi:hypothetical protein
MLDKFLQIIYNCKYNTKSNKKQNEKEIKTMNNGVGFTKDGFVGTIEWNEDTYLWEGKLLDTGNDVITYGGEGLDDLYADFIDAVDEYLKELGDGGNYIITRQ